ncbi:MAG TPA: CHAT domain-containing protein [Thermoanaerobaculia bacterium]
MPRTLPLLLILALSFPSWGQGAEPADFAACDKLAASQPESEETTRCYDKVGETLQRPEETAERFRRLLERHPGSPWPSLFLGILELGDRERAEALFRTAVKGFAARKDAWGEVLARANLHRLLFNAGRIDDAGVQADLALKAAEAAGHPEAVARAQILKARHLWSVGQDFEQVYLLLRRATATAVESDNYYTKREALNMLGNISVDLGRSREGYEAFRRAVELAVAERDRSGEAEARYGMSRAVLDEAAEIPTEERRQEVIRLARATLEAALAADYRSIQARAHWQLGTLLSGEEAYRHLEACLEAANITRDRSYCLNAMARHFASTDPRRAQAAIDESLELAREAKDYWSMAFAWRERMRVSWAAARPYQQVVRDSREALEAIETLRELQASSTNQARAFAAWSEDYYWLSGRLIEAALSGHRPEAVGSAFLVAERMRARTLLDKLEAAKALPEAALPLRRRRAAVMEEISAVQRRLLNPDLPAAERAEATRHLSDLEIEEAEIQNQLARAAPPLAEQPRLSGIPEVRQALAANEALLSFQVAPWEDPWKDFSGGSWLTVVTRQGARAYRLPGRGELRSAVRLFNGTFNRRDGSEVTPAVALYRKLLEPALKDLPPGIEELILIPDDVLNQLPFGALRAAKEARPLAARYMLSQAPSATLWLEWKKDKPSPARTPALVFADPPPPGGDNGQVALASLERSAAVFASTTRLGPLPFARQESRSVVSHMGGGSIRRLGEKAAEAFLKHAPLHEYALLHFATHAVTDEANPERSGVLLAPGDAAEDGLLQIREIVDLYLKGRTVVLSACSTNTGAVLRGEGVMSLARAFFQAGAHTVVASLWKLRDDEAAEFFDRFYDHLGRGLSVAASAHAAQRELIEDGAPAAAWAGIVVLGDGDAVPLPGGRRGPALPSLPAWAWSLAGGVLLLAALGGLYWFRRRPAISPV